MAVIIKKTAFNSVEVYENTLPRSGANPLTINLANLVLAPAPPGFYGQRADLVTSLPGNNVVVVSTQSGRDICSIDRTLVSGALCDPVIAAPALTDIESFLNVLKTVHFAESVSSGGGGIGVGGATEATQQAMFSFLQSSAARNTDIAAAITAINNAATNEAKEATLASVLAFLQSSAARNTDIAAAITAINNAATNEAKEATLASVLTFLQSSAARSTDISAAITAINNAATNEAKEATLAALLAAINARNNGTVGTMPAKNTEVVGPSSVTTGNKLWGIAVSVLPGSTAFPTVTSQSTTTTVTDSNPYNVSAAEGSSLSIHTVIVPTGCTALVQTVEYP